MTVDEFQSFWTSVDKSVVKQKHQMMLLAGFIFGILTPYETGNIPYVLLQFLYWVGLIIFTSIISGPVGRKVFSKISVQNTSAAFSIGLYSVALSIPVYIVVALSDIIIGGLFISPQSFTLDNLLKYFSDIEYGFFGYILWFGQVWIVVALLIGAISLLADKFKKTDPTKAPVPAGILFLNRLPAELGRDLICLSMEDHYLRVYTKLGHTLILMRMADAIAELSDYNGFQVHRSWWIAVNAVTKTSKTGRKYTIHLSNGKNVPVSQTYVEKLKQSELI